VIGQKVGRDQYKLDNLFWPRLTAATWSKMLQEFAKFKVYVTFPDMVNNDWITIWMYPGDRTATPAKISKATGLPTIYTSCKCNVIDYGLV
jgi:hypothetical protein